MIRLFWMPMLNHAGHVPLHVCHYQTLHEGFGNDIREVEHGRHGSALASKKAGSSVYGYADGSVRALKFGNSFQPINQWATESIWRTNTSIFIIMIMKIEVLVRQIDSVAH